MNQEEKILIIGNGFDLAHKLPTSYMDFLEFAKRFNLIFMIENEQSKYRNCIDNWDGNYYVKETLLEIYNNKIIIYMCSKINSIINRIKMKIFYGK